LDDIIGSAHDRPAGDRLRRVRRVIRAAWRVTGRQRRPAAGVLALVTVTGVLVALRATLPDPAPARWSALTTLDRLPGRQPIPAPVPVGDGQVVEGDLPIGPDSGGGRDSGQVIAVRAASMVLGRYCWNPGPLAITASTAGAVGYVIRVTEPRTDRLIAVIVLYQDGRGGHYQWRGWLDQLRHCR
jgi:hypothetical protein